MIKNKHRVRYINAFIAVSIAAIRTFQIDGINLRVLNIHFGGKSRNGYGKNHNKCDNRSKNLFHIIHIPPFFGKRKSIFAEYLPSAATRRTHSNICYHSPPRLSTPFPHLTKLFLICVKLCRKKPPPCVAWRRSQTDYIFSVCFCHLFLFVQKKCGNNNKNLNSTLSFRILTDSPLYF